MKIATGSQVSLEYTLKLDDESVFGTNVGAAPLVYRQGSGEMIPALERELEGLGAGDSKQVTIPPADGYGPDHPEAIREIPKDKIPPDAQRAGAVLQSQGTDGKPIRARVVEVKDKTVVVDFNHPLAGETLHFSVKVLDVKPVAAGPQDAQR